MRKVLGLLAAIALVAGFNMGCEDSDNGNAYTGSWLLLMPADPSDAGFLTEIGEDGTIQFKDPTDGSLKASGTYTIQSDGSLAGEWVTPSHGLSGICTATIASDVMSLTFIEYKDTGTKTVYYAGSRQ